MVFASIALAANNYSNYNPDWESKYQESSFYGLATSLLSLTQMVDASGDARGNVRGPRFAFNVVRIFTYAFGTNMYKSAYHEAPIKFIMDWTPAAILLVESVKTVALVAMGQYAAAGILLAGSTVLLLAQFKKLPEKSYEWLDRISLATQVIFLFCNTQSILLRITLAAGTALFVANERYPKSWLSTEQPDLKQFEGWFRSAPRLFPALARVTLVSQLFPLQQGSFSSLIT